MFKVPSDSSLPSNPMQGTNIIIPVSVQKEPLSSSKSGAKRAKDGKSEVDVPPTQKRKGWPTEDDLKTKRPKDGNSGVDVPPPKKRKVWSTEDDLKLTAAVQKHGEQKWANIAGGEFKNDRTPEELSMVLLSYFLVMLIGVAILVNKGLIVELLLYEHFWDLISPKKKKNTCEI